MAAEKSAFLTES